MRAQRRRISRASERHAINGSDTVAGTADPDPTPGNGCITIFDCANGACGDGDDIVLGTGSSNAGGAFVVSVAPPLVTGQRIFARDTCNNLDSAAVIVQFSAQVPTLNELGVTVLVVALALAVAIRAMAARRAR